VTGLPVIIGELIVLLLKVSVPAKVASVPELGKVILLAAVVVIVRSPIPLVMILFAMVIVLPLLLTPVPPLLLDKIPVIVVAESENIALFDVNE
jgi:hypothetical protein